MPFGRKLRSSPVPVAGRVRPLYSPATGAATDVCAAPTDTAGRDAMYRTTAIYVFGLGATLTLVV